MALRHQILKFVAIFLVGIWGPIGLSLLPSNLLAGPIAPVIAPSLDAEQLYQQGRQQFTEQAYEEALNSFTNAVETAIAANDRGLAAEALYQLGRTYHELGSYRRALDQYETSLELWDELANRGVEVETVNDVQFNRAVVLTGMGRSLRVLGDYEPAQARYDAALAIHTELGSRREQAIVLDEIANLRRSQVQYEEALRFHEQALAVVEGVYPQDESRVLNNIGVTYQSLGRYEQALRTYDRALNIAGIDRTQEMTVLINIASIHVTQNDLATAEQLYQQLLEMRGEGSQSINPVREAILAASVGGFYAAQQRYEDALGAYEQALNLYIQQGDRTQEALLRSNIGTVFTNLGDYEQAETFYLEALEIYEAINDLSGKGQVLNNLGQLYDLLEDESQSRIYYQRAIDEVFESSLANIQSSRLKADFANLHADVYSRLIALLWDSGDYRQAFDYVERSRARAFLDQVANGPIRFRADIEGRFLAQEKAKRDALIQLQDELDGLVIAAAEPEQVAAHRAKLAEKRQAYLDFVEQLRRRSSQAADLTSVNPASLEDIQALLNAQTTLVEYFTLDDRVLAFVMTQNTFHAQALALDHAQASEAVQSFYEYDFATLASPHPQSLRQLQASLIAPLQTYITTEKLAIAPHGILHYVPFAALTDGQQHLVDQYQLIQLPSANVLRFLEAPSQNAGNPVVFGNPTFDLPFAAEEARVISELYGTQPFLGKAATEEQLRSQAGQASILHLATHGEYNADNPLFSQILLADSTEGGDGRLQIHEIYELDLTANTQLVVLSACQTQVGDASDGDEIIGLNRAFLYAGTPNVIATLWPISDEATAELMKQFYGFLQQDLSTAEALQQAQQVIKANPDYAHPYYWAGFGLTGNGQ